MIIQQLTKDLNIEEKKNTMRFKQVEERTLKELFFPDSIFNNKIKNEFLAEAHRRLSSPLLVILMCSLASCAVLIGEMKKKMLLKNIIISSFIAIFIQATYISAINRINFSSMFSVFPYIILILLSLFSILLIRHENNLIKLKQKLKNEIKY